MLVNKRIKELTQFTDQGASARPQLKKVYVTDSEIVATNGHVLAIMPVDKGLSDDNYPAGPELTPAEEPITLTTEQIGTALSILPKKPTLLILNNIQIGIANDAPAINAGLPVIQIPGNKNDDNSTYPEYKRVIPEYDETNSVMLSLDGALLKQLCTLATRYDAYGGKRLTLTIPTESYHVVTASKWEVKENSDVLFHGVIMPLRIDG